VLSYLFEHVYPRVSDRFEFDLLSGTSVGAIHAAYVAASAHMEPVSRSRQLVETWRGMRVQDVLRLSVRDLAGAPLRALGLTRLMRRARAGREDGDEPELIGGLVDLSPLERLVVQRIPWPHLRDNLAETRPGALCISCTEIRSGRVAVFMDGQLANPEPWSHDPNAKAIPTAIGAQHVRASAAIPFLFPAVRIGERYYVDGGLRMNTPLSPALRLGADRLIVIALKHARPSQDSGPAYSEDVITQPAFLLGKVLDALMLDQMEYELQRVGLVNALIERGNEVFGEGFLEKINVAVREQRGADYRHVATAVVRPSEDVGRMAAECYQRQGGRRSMGVLPALLTWAASRGTPPEEADLLSYVFFDRCFTSRLVELGREDARQAEAEIFAVLEG
jgi:NTE family protein